jgi:hypothetical protein
MFFPLLYGLFYWKVQGKVFLHKLGVNQRKSVSSLAVFAVGSVATSLESTGLASIQRQYKARICDENWNQNGISGINKGCASSFSLRFNVLYYR